MRNPIETVAATGSTLYVILHNPNGKVWNTSSVAWETYNSANWSLYAIPLTEQGSSGYYSAAYPADATDVLATEVLYAQAGGTPAISDGPVNVGQSQGVDLVAVGTNVRAAANLLKTLLGMIQSSVAAGASTPTVFFTTLDSTIANCYQGRMVLFTSGNLIDQVANISAYSAVYHTLTVAGPFTETPAEGDTFIIV